MELAARRFARWVMAIHLLLLAGMGALIFFAAREIYFSSRQQAIAQAARRQTMLAAQTARGIQDYYQAIAQTIELLRSAQFQAIDKPIIWDQLNTRAALLLMLNQDNGSVEATFPLGNARIPPESLADELATRETTVTDLFKIGDNNVNFVCVPSSSPGPKRLIMVGIPIANTAERFLHDVDADQRMSAMLLDQTMRVMDAHDKQIVGLSVIADGQGVNQVKEIAARYLQLGTAGTEVIERGFQLGEHVFDGGIVTVQPVQVLGKRWWLTIGSDMTDVNSVVRGTLQQVLWWGILVLTSVTAILVSTAVQMIRSRVRLERARHEALARELAQARKIQLAWLPKNEDDPPHVDLCAINKPASHISGDFYNWFDLCDGRVCVVIGDVTGHGTAAAFLMATTQLLVRTTMPRVLDPGKCLEEINRQLCQQVFNGQFVTMLVMLLDRQNGRIELATAGHPAPLIATNGQFEELKVEPELVLGIEKSCEYPTRSFALPPVARLVLYTDGVVDAIRPDEKRFGLDRLRQCMDKPSKDAQAIADCIIGSIDTFRAGRELVDDLTLVTIQLKPENS